MKTYIVSENLYAQASIRAASTGCGCNACRFARKDAAAVQAAAVGGQIPTDNQYAIQFTANTGETLEEVGEAEGEPTAPMTEESLFGSPAPETSFYDRLTGVNPDHNLQASSQRSLEAQHESLMDTIAASPLYEAEFVLHRLERGKVHGGTFGSGNKGCSCLLGTMQSAANYVNKIPHYSRIDGEDLGQKLTDLNIYHRPAQDLFGGIGVGDKPSNNLSAALAHQFITELLMSNRAELGREERAAYAQLRKAGLVRGGLRRGGFRPKRRSAYRTV